LAPDDSSSANARRTLLEALRDHGLVIGEVTLASGRTASYYIDARRVLLLPEPFRAVGELVAGEARMVGAVAVGGPTMGAIPIACAAIGVPEGSAMKAFFVRAERKQHGLQRWVEGPEIAPGERALVVEDTVTSGKSFVTAIERIKEEGIEIAAAFSVVDRLAGGRDAIQEALGPSAPYRPLFTIDDVYPDRPDR
jgi:orotate phosphoribosyltransferase